MIFRVDGVTRVSERAELRTVLIPLGAAQVFRAGTDAKPVSLKKLRVLLLRNALRKRSSSYRGEEIRQQKFTQPGCFVAKIDLIGIAEHVVAFGQEEVRGIVRIISIHGARRLAPAEVNHPGIPVKRCEICAPDGAVLIEQQ